MPDLFSDHISNEEIQQLPLLSFEGDIYIVDDESSFREAIRILQGVSVLGFDTEKKPTFKKGQYHPTALVQLATFREVFLFRLNEIGYEKRLFDLLSDPYITKYGISIDDDLRELVKLRDFKPAGFIDLNSVTNSMGVKHNGVRKLAALMLNGRISKSQQTSNWENENLTLAQQKYAATDAWVCLKIYEALENLN